MTYASLPRLLGAPKASTKESCHRGSEMYAQVSSEKEVNSDDMPPLGHLHAKMQTCAGGRAKCLEPKRSTQVCLHSEMPLPFDMDEDTVSNISIPELQRPDPKCHLQEWQSTGPAIPWQAAARMCYPWLMPIFSASVIISSISAVLVFLYVPGWRIWMEVASQIPMCLIILMYAFSLVFPVMNYVYHYCRLRASIDLPELPDMPPLIHAVVVCAYKEPLDVLHRTMDSIMAQHGLGRKPIVVFASEARDHTAQSCFNVLSQHVGNSFELFLLTKHELEDGEAVGKSSNENWAVRELYRLLVKEQGSDPFEVMVTIVDADSVLSNTYLAHTEASFRAQRDGRRLIYNGPLNVYRNFGDANVFVQCHELIRCHGDLFHDPLRQYVPQSNYSLTLGLCHEIDFWTPDVMPEDIHTCNKVKLNSFGSWSTVAIPSLICNDLVTDFKDRYVQAKRHQFGSITEFAWILSLYNIRKLSVQAWAAVFLGELGRAGSFLDVAHALVGLVFKFFMMAFIVNHWTDFKIKVKLLLIMMISTAVWKYLLFWLAEFMVWEHLMRQFPVKKPSVFRWCVLVAFMPVLSIVCEFVFFIGATLDGLYHITLKGELAYICAPKGDAGRADASDFPTIATGHCPGSRLFGRRAHRSDSRKKIMAI